MMQGIQDGCVLVVGTSEWSARYSVEHILGFWQVYSSSPVVIQYCKVEIKETSNEVISKTLAGNL